MGSLIFFFFSAHQPALLVPYFELRGSFSGYDNRHRIRAVRVIFQKLELDHVMSLLQNFNGYPLSMESHPNTIAWQSSATFFSHLISFLLLSKCLFWLEWGYLTFPRPNRKYHDVHVVSVFVPNFPHYLWKHHSFRKHSIQRFSFPKVYFQKTPLHSFFALPEQRFSVLGLPVLNDSHWSMSVCPSQL